MQLFKGNKKVTGTAASFSFNSKEGSLFIQLISQTGYSEDRHLATFSGGKKLTIKSGVTEIGSLLDVLNRNIEYSTVHRGQNGDMTQIWFAPYLVGDENSKVQKGYGLRVSRKSQDGQEFKLLLPINFGEAASLKVYLDFALRHIFAAEYAEQKRRYQDTKSVKVKAAPLTEKAAEIPEEI